MKPPRLTLKQKERLEILDSKFKKSVFRRDYAAAKSLVIDMQALLMPTGHRTLLIKYKNRLYELALETGKVEIALSGLNSNRAVMSSNTRLYLEATALLAICYLRLRDIESAKPLIRDVLTNDSVIKTERTRNEFRIEVINRFDQEIALYSLKNNNEDLLSLEELENKISELLRKNSTEKELLIYIGKNAPPQTKDLLFQVHQFSFNLLPSAEKLLLPNPEQKIKDSEVGKTVFQSLKRVIYDAICNPESEVYKAWYTNGISMVLSKNYIRATILATLSKIGIGVTMISAYLITLLLKIGLEVFCDYHKPIDLMNLRGK